MLELMTQSMTQDMTRPMEQRLEVQSAMILALSRVFVNGGEKLTHTLPLLIEAYEDWVDCFLVSNPALEQLQEAFKAHEPSTLAFEYNRLFIGPASPQAPLYESVYHSQHGLVMQETTLAVRELYRAEQLQLSWSSNEPDDFIAIELDFAGYLLQQAAECLTLGRSDRSCTYIEKYNNFCREHLQTWTAEFAHRLESSATLPLFKTLAEVIRQTLKLFDANLVPLKPLVNSANSN